MSGWAGVLGFVGAALQVAGVWFTIVQARSALAVREMVRRRWVAAGRWVRGSGSTVTVDVEACIGFDVLADVEVRHADESDMEWLTREVRQNRRAIAELERELSGVEARAQRVLVDRLDEFEREAAKKSERNSELMLWGAGAIIAGILVQTAGSLLA